MLTHTQQYNDDNHHKTSRVKQQKETFVSIEFDSSYRDTMTSVKQDSKYKIEVDDENVTVTGLTEEDKKLVAEILRQIGLVHAQNK